MPLGTPYGKYVLLERIASGGMGEVFLAHPRGGDGSVVVKRMLDEHAGDPEHLDQFLEEARLQARFDHPSLVRILDLGRADDGSLYLAMEYVHGRSLAETLVRLRQARQRMEPGLAAQIAERAADALGYAHKLADDSGRSLEIVHRDVSPHNLLVSYQGEVKLIDFGIAKSARSTGRTETGAIKGKFQYMSPEQSACSAVDRRSDIFSLGIVLYECLTGENPFVRSSVVLSLDAIQKVDPPPPSATAPSLAPFDGITARALAKRPADRYADAGEMRDELAHARGLLPAPREELGPFIERLFQEGQRASTAPLAPPVTEAAWRNPRREASSDAAEPADEMPAQPIGRPTLWRLAPLLGLALAAGLGVSLLLRSLRAPGAGIAPTDQLAAIPEPSVAAEPRTEDAGTPLPPAPEPSRAEGSGAAEPRPERPKRATADAEVSRPPRREAVPSADPRAATDAPAAARVILWVRPLPSGEVWLDGAQAQSPLQVRGRSGVVDVACQGSPLRIRLVLSEGALENPKRPLGHRIRERIVEGPDSRAHLPRRGDDEGGAQAAGFGPGRAAHRAARGALKSALSRSAGARREP